MVEWVTFQLIVPNRPEIKHVTIVDRRVILPRIVPIPRQNKMPTRDDGVDIDIVHHNIILRVTKKWNKERRNSHVIGTVSLLVFLHVICVGKSFSHRAPWLSLLMPKIIHMLERLSQSPRTFNPSEGAQRVGWWLCMIFVYIVFVVLTSFPSFSICLKYF